MEQDKVLRIISIIAATICVIGILSVIVICIVNWGPAQAFVVIFLLSVLPLLWLLNRYTLQHRLSLRQGLTIGIPATLILFAICDKLLLGSSLPEIVLHSFVGLFFMALIISFWVLLAKLIKAVSKK